MVSRGETICFKNIARLMNATALFFIASAILCFLLVAFANPIFQWSNRWARKLGLRKLADFRERLWPVLGPIARIALLLTGVLILILTWKLMAQ